VIRELLVLPAKKELQRKNVGPLVQDKDLRARERLQSQASLRADKLNNLLQSTLRTIWHQRRSKGNSLLLLPWSPKRQKFSTKDQLLGQVLQDGVQL